MLSRLPTRGIEGHCRQRCEPSSLWHQPSVRCSCPHARQSHHSERSVVTSSGRGSQRTTPSAPEHKGPATVPLPPPSTTKYVEGQFVEVGTVAGAFGIKGEVRVEISTDNPRQRFGVPGKRIYLRPPAATGLLARMQDSPEQGMLALTTSSAKIQVLPKGEEAWLVQFKELKDRSQAQQLLSYTMHIPVTDRERLRDPDEFWVQDLVGSRAFLKNGSTYVGRVIDVIDGTGTHDTLVLQLMLSNDDISNSRNRVCMIPFAKAICPIVDRKLKQLVIDPPEGLLDMFTYRPMRRPLTDQQKEERKNMLRTTTLPVLGQPYNNVSDGATAASTSAAGPVQTKQQTASASKPASTQVPGAPQAQQAPVGNRPATTDTARVQQAPDEVVVDDVDDEDEGEDDMEEVEESSTPLTATDKWKQRRKLGVSFASKQRRQGGRLSR